MQNFGLNLIAILFLLVFLIMLVWLLVRVGSIIELVKSERNEKVDGVWAQKQLANFTDEELEELKQQLNLNS
ncbi:hypothetical protein NMK71_10370 [Weeksellaceae bacterium KMM 9713]|uniref:Uncharacterized protein n=1 Tax=Profundicola chukchiensis TaxID=2961959 RepID=A0A9X4MXR5_9FLAO|nr:hypothetical protein [Profundicola chukchiensis]MDG4946821.1 hypothetical protein [Profundicola chukchiensis]